MLLELLSAGIIFITLIACTLIPYCYLLRGNRNDSKNSFTLSISNCVACGVFLSTCFLGLIPHVRHQEMQLRSEKSHNETITTQHDEHVILNTEAVVLIGFLLILVIEQSLLICSSPSSHSSSTKRAPTLRTLLASEGEDGQPLVDTTLDTDDDGMQDIVFRSSSPLVDRSEASSGGGGHSHVIPMEDGLTARTLFLLLGLSIHSVFEGVALGVQKEKSDFINVLIAIMFHEVLCCVAYGIAMAQQRTPVRSAISTVLILSASIPAGMLIAVVVDEMDSNNPMMVRFILEGLAAGTFVYVACVEMLGAELGHSHGGDHHDDEHGGHSHSHPSKYKGLAKAAAVSGGVAIFWGLQLAIGGGHHSS